jgi:NADPH:quinone reductase-like Zn-dependent oxidoreductase
VGSRSDLGEMNRVIALPRIHPIIDRVFPFDAFTYFETGSRFGKVVIAN